MAAATDTEAITVRARARYLRVAPRKARLVADQVRGLPVTEAQELLAFSTRGAAADIRELIAEEMEIAEIRVDEGPTLKRWRARARGRATRIEKKTSHVSVALKPSE